MKRTIRIIASSAAAVAALVGVAVTAEASTAHHNAPSATARSVAARSTDGGVEVSAWGLIVNIRNDSSHPLTFLNVDGRTSKNPPKAVLNPGDTDRLAYSADSTGMFVRLTYRVGDTAETVSPAFSVPSIGPNNFACSANDRSAKSPVGSKCDIGKGWEPDAHLTFVNR